LLKRDTPVVVRLLRLSTSGSNASGIVTAGS
jgi:hypothetical protein